MKGKLTFFNSFIFLFIITFFGAILRIINLSPFKIYPDSYQPLLVAENIRTYHSVVGYLGTQGMFYPDFFMWTRPGYPFTLDLFNFFIHDPTHSAQIVSVTAGILAIPLAFFFLRNVFGSTQFGLVGGLILALSFNHTVWSGFIMTETLGVFFLLLFLWSLFINLKTKTSFVNVRDLLTGLFFSFAILTRYEYILLVIPVLFLVWRLSKQPLIRMIKIISSCILVLVLVTLLLFPWQSMFLIIPQQLAYILPKNSAIFFINIVIVLLVIKKYTSFFASYLHIGIIVFLWTIAFLIFLQFYIGPQSLFWTELSAIRNFVSHDFLLSLFSLVGFTLLLQKQTLQTLGLFTFIAILFLGIIYYRINPDMERYVTHLIPFLLIPASYGARKIILIKKPLILFLLSLLFILQVVSTYQGLRKQQDGSWFRVSYEEKAARQIKQHVKTSDLLIVSLPEPYFYNTNLSTQSLTDTYPFLYIDDSLNNNHVVLIVDMGMQTNYPIFTKFINSNLKKYKTEKFWVKENYHYLDQTVKETQPVSLYELTLKELKDKIKDSF